MKRRYLQLNNVTPAAWVACRYSSAAIFHTARTASGLHHQPKRLQKWRWRTLNGVEKSVVSFGQGCEGDPLLAVDVIEPAVRLIRFNTQRGTININTNGSLPETLKRLIDAGLDSIRISMNSVREDCYHAYFRPKGYRFADVLKSIDLALESDIFVAINYLNCPGFSDTPQELKALHRFLKQHRIHMIQWRNLNFDPLRYFKIMNGVAPNGKPIGMKRLLEQIRREFPSLKFGYFNPPKEKF